MTKYIVVIVVSCFMLCFGTSCGYDGCLIRGEISNLESPYILATHLLEDTLSIDTVYVDDKGRFSYCVDIDTMTVFSFYLNDFENAAVVFANKDEKLTVKGDALFPDLIRINGNEINDDLTLFKIQNEDLLKQRSQLLHILRDASELDTILSNSIIRHEEIGRLNVLNHELTIKAEEFIKDNPAKLSSLILIGNFFINSDNPAALERVLGYLQGEAAETVMASRLSSYSEKLNRSAEGAYMPYFSLEDKDGVAIKSSDYAGKYLVLSFISTAGNESRENVELLKNAYSRIDNDSVEFITIYIDTDHYPMEQVESDSIPWAVVAEEQSWSSSIVDNFNVQYVPFNILISPDRTIQVRNIAPQGIVGVVNKPLKEKIVTNTE